MLARIRCIRLHRLNFKQRLLMRSSRPIFSAPIHRGIQRNAIKPRRGVRLALKLGQRTPRLKQNFLSKILTFVTGQRVCSISKVGFGLYSSLF